MEIKNQRVYYVVFFVTKYMSLLTGAKLTYKPAL